MRAGTVIRSIAAMSAAFVAYLKLLRPWHLRWGATQTEANAELPGDELIDDPTLVSTRAVTVDAEPGDIWPWLVQLGQGRGGFYTYDWIENLFGLDIHSADRILREHQGLGVGDRIALARDGSGLDVERIESGRALVLREPSGGWTWAFVLEPQDGSTRFVIRDRWTTRGAPVSFRAYMAVIDPAAFIMERGMLLGLKRRVEGSLAADTS